MAEKVYYKIQGLFSSKAGDWWLDALSPDEVDDYENPEPITRTTLEEIIIEYKFISNLEQPNGKFRIVKVVETPLDVVLS